VPAKTAIAMIAAALIVSLAVARLASRRIDGYTGDVLGACEVIVECVVLTIAASGPLF
jgi:adenosylcobinamide-GDP ribazoletransferase